jgi:hypothetical protein
MAGPNSFQQTIEFAHEVNQRSEQDVLRRREDFLRSLQDADQGVDVAQGAIVDQGEATISSTEQRYLDDYGQYLTKRSGARRDEVAALERGEDARGQESGSVFASWLQQRRKQELGLDDTLGTVAGQHAGVLLGLEQRVGTKRSKSTDWLDRVVTEAHGIVGSLARRYNQFASITGLVRVPTSMTEFARFAKDQHDRLRMELGKSLQASSLSGWRLGDVRRFMVALNEQRAEFPSLSSELDQTIDVLARNLPNLGGEKTLDLGSDIRRAAFLLGEGTDVSARDVGELSRLTKRSGDDVVAAFLTVRDIAGSTRAKGGRDPEVAVGVLRKFFVDLVRQGIRYGVTLEESAALTQRYSGAIKRDAISTGDLIRFITGFTTTEAGNKSALAFEIVSKLQGRHEFKKLLAEIQPLFRRGDVEGAALLMDALVTGSTVTLQRDFGIAPRESAELRREAVASIHEVVAGWVAANTVQDQHVRRYVENVILADLGIGGQGTYDQQEVARTFRLRAKQLHEGFDPDAKAKIDAEMQQQENEFDKIAGRTNAVLLRLSNSVDSFVRNFSLGDLDVVWDKLKTGAATLEKKIGPLAPVVRSIVHATVTGPVGDRIRRNVEHAKRSPIWSNIEGWTQRFASEFGLDPTWLQAQIVAESGGSPTAISNKNAMGLTQFIPGTARRYLDKLGIAVTGDLRTFLNNHPDIMVKMQAAYMSDIRDLARKANPSGSEEEIYAMMLAGYIAGEGAMLKAYHAHGGEWLLHMSSDVRNYVRDIGQYANLLGGATEPVEKTGSGEAGAKAAIPAASPAAEPGALVPPGSEGWTPQDEADYRKAHGGKPSDFSPTPEEQRKFDELHGRGKHQSSADTYRVTVAAVSVDAAYNKVLTTFARGGIAGLQGIGAARIGGAA